jgi:NAD(P)-dependent dehydrogenase (short-subunit alcohol dehydrogenase family)
MPTALITGGASLLGEGAARALVEDGWKVVLADINLKGAEQVVKDIGGAKVASAVALDVTDIKAVRHVVDDVVQKHGRIDGLLNAAGGFRGLGIPWREFMDTTPKEWEALLRPNLVGVFNVCHSVLPKMKAQGKGAIVSIAASRGLRGGKKATIYSAAKAGIIVFTQSLAQEVGPLGIRVNSIAPGNAEARWKTPDMEGQGKTVPLGRETSAADVGNAVAFLLSDRACHITGSCMDVSGGTTLH